MISVQIHLRFSSFTLAILVLTKSDVASVIIKKHIGYMGKRDDAILTAKGGHTCF